MAAASVLSLPIGAASLAPVLPSSLGRAQIEISAELIQRGQYVARAADCIACHSAPGGPPYAGGLKMNTPFGAMFSPNITPHPSLGIGQYSFEDFDKAVRRGMRKDGGRLYPAMPYPSFSGITPQDMQALYAYFMLGVEPQAVANRAHLLPWPFSMRSLLRVWTALFYRERPFVEDPARDASWNRGAYLVRVLGHCGACHTPRGLAGQEKAMSEADGLRYLSGAVIDDWYAPNLPKTLQGSAFQWSADELAEFLATGRNQRSASVGPMVDVIGHSMQHLSDADRRAIADYLLSLPVNESGEAAPPADVDAAVAATAQRLRDLDVSVAGARLYIDNCQGCHRADGTGDPRTFPALAGNAVVLGREPNSLVAMILRGSAMPSTQRAPSALSMPGFGWRLSDDEIAELATFLRSSWGNAAAPVSTAQVRRLRERFEAHGAHR
ncbi:MAG: cytochrome c [Burkholderiales bacterium]|nr:cytochrome c [Burkholderiales bacterium]